MVPVCVVHRALRRPAVKEVRTCCARTWLLACSLACWPTRCLGWWSLDPVVALGIAALALREGVEAWRGQDCC
jgi:hypothetical protein